MARLMPTCLVLALAVVSTTAAAQPKKATLPAAGDTLPLTGAAEWPKLSWLYEAPSADDAAGKVVIHWFCSPSPRAVAQTCADDLQRIINLRDTGHVYIVAYIAGGHAQAKKLDPIRESEGVGKGTVAYGYGAMKLMKQLGVTEAAIVVDVDGKVKAVTTSGDLNELDGRDSVVNQLISAIKDFTTSHSGPDTVKAGDKFQLSFQVQLASWLAFATKEPMEFTLSAPKDIQCDATTLRGDQLKIDGHTLTATVTCSAPKGVYEAQGQIRFSYASPGGATGEGADGTTYKFTVE